MLKAHPYEEVAYDIYPLENKGRVWGLGRVGWLQEEMTLAKFAEHVKKSLDVPAVRVVGNLHDKVKKVAVVGGDGNKYIWQAKMSGADVYVTGDVYYHVAHDAMALRLNIVDPGHNVEKVMKHGVARYFEQEFAKQKWSTTVYVSQMHTDPFAFL